MTSQNHVSKNLLMDRNRSLEKHNPLISGARVVHLFRSRAIQRAKELKM